VMGEPWDCIMSHNSKNVTKTFFAHSHNQILKQKWHLKHGFMSCYKYGFKHK
jgi:hypothetical protein